VLIDENSCNGTMVNGCRISTSTALRPGDIVRFGTSICQVSRIPLREDITRHSVAVSSAAGQDRLCIAARIALVDSVQRLHEAESH
jgi:pSer/pThr/pTyr-binding forkhead associated (FHA) protein